MGAVDGSATRSAPGSNLATGEKGRHRTDLKLWIGNRAKPAP